MASVTVLTWDVLITFSDEVSSVEWLSSPLTIKPFILATDFFDMDVCEPIDFNFILAQANVNRKQWTPAKGLYTVVRYLPWLFQL